MAHHTDRIAPAWVLQWCESTGRRVRLRTGADDAVPAQTDPMEVVLSLPRLPAQQPPRGLVVVALRELPDEEQVLSTAAEAAAYVGAALAVRHAVPVSFGPRSVGIGDAVDHGHLLLAAAHDQLATAHLALPVVTELRRMWPHELVGESVDADMLVIGGPRPHSRALGLVARTAVHHAFCPLLLVPRPSVGASPPPARPRHRTPPLAVQA
jgi:nucleotide-binding universal stress UspA family protein